MKLTQGLWLVGEFEGASERTVSPKTDGKQFTPFKIEVVHLVVNDEPRAIEWREGKRPPVDDFVQGDLVVVPARVGRVYNGVPQFEGRSLPILSNE